MNSVPSPSLPYQRDQSVPAVFQLQAGLHPEALAMVSGADRFTYRELNERANRLAHYLQRQGVRAGTLVGLLMDRSPELVISILAIVKAGAAYVPLDLNSPPQRLGWVADDAGISLVLTKAMPELAGPLQRLIRVVDLDIAHPEIDAQPAENLSLPCRGEDLAYVMFTSGSTGRPKGVAVPHRAVLRLVLENPFVPFDQRLTFLLLAPTAFDASTLELWGPLLHGGRLVIHPAGPLDFEELGRVIRDQAVDCLWLTAALYNAVIDYSPSLLRGLRWLLIGGEALSVRHVRRGLAVLDGTQIINGYGPTENTTFTCTYPIPRELAADSKSVPIGGPIAHTQVFILDEDLDPVPDGETGELCTGGDGLAWGYWRRADLTAERFVPNPFSDQPGTRLHRTGDLVRRRADGSIEFLGRIDTQVKLRGFRIELGEIEAVLGEHPAVRQAVVVLREAPASEPQLVAYWVGKNRVELDGESLRRWLRERLPDYMVPASGVALDRLPLNANGKVDRAALPAPEAVAAPTPASAPPRTPFECALADIWTDLLHLAGCGSHDNFFALGGHSLLMTQVCLRARQQFQTELPLSLFYENLTIADQAMAITLHLGTVGGDADLIRQLAELEQTPAALERSSA